MKAREITLSCKNVRFYSEHDEDAFFEWIKKIPCITNFFGKGDTIFVEIDMRKITLEMVFDIDALFRRYKINRKQITKLLDNAENEEAYYKYKEHFSINRYPL